MSTKKGGKHIVEEKFDYLDSWSFPNSTMEDGKKIITYQYIEYDEDGKEIARWLELGLEPDCQNCKGKMWIKKYDGGILELFPRSKGKHATAATSEVIKTFTYVMCECNPQNRKEEKPKSAMKKDLYAVYKDIEKEATSLASSTTLDTILTRNKKRRMEKCD